MLPTQDKEAKEQIADYFAKQGYTTIEKSRGTVGEFIFYKQADTILTIIEKLGYYKGLPPSIEEALNSGDGAYRP